LARRSLCQLLNSWPLAPLLWRISRSLGIAKLTVIGMFFQDAEVVSIAFDRFCCMKQRLKACEKTERTMRRMCRVAAGIVFGSQDRVRRQ